MNWSEMIFASIGTLLLFIASIACWVWSYQLAAPYLLGATAQGEVVEVLKYSSRDGDFHRLLVEFLASGEAKHRLIGQSNDESHYKIGAPVKVLYDPKDPETAVIADFTLLFVGLFLTGLLGLLSLGGGILAFRRSWRSYKTFGPKFHRKMDAATREMDRPELAKDKRILLKGVVESVRRSAASKEYVVVCRATLPGATRPEHFEARPISFHPGPAILGRSVEIYVDPGNRSDQAVMLEPVLADLQSAKR